MLLTIAQAAGIRRVDRTTVLRWISRDGLKAQQVGSYWLINRGDLDRFKPRPAGKPKLRKTGAR